MIRRRDDSPFDADSFSAQVERLRERLRKLHRRADALMEDLDAIVMDLADLLERTSAAGASRVVLRPPGRTSSKGASPDESAMLRELARHGVSSLSIERARRRSHRRCQADQAAAAAGGAPARHCRRRARR